MGKSTISMAIFNSYVDITRGYFKDLQSMRRSANFSQVWWSSVTVTAAWISLASVLPLPLGDEADADHPNTVRSVVMVGICWDDYTNIVYVGI